MQTTALLSIFRTADTYSFQFSAPGDHVRATKLFATLAQEQTTAKQLNHQLDSIARLLNQLQLPGVGAPPQRSITDHDALLALGRLLYSNLFPAAIQQALHLLPPETSLLLATDEPAIPWELAHDGTNYLGLTFNVGRQLLQPTLHPPPSQRHAPKWATLFIGNPTDDLPETMRELEAIVELVEALPGVAPPMVLVRDRATKERILHELASGAYDLIHYSGHAHVDAHNHAESGLLLADNQRLTANEIARNLAGSPFIFLNGCESSRAAPDQQRAATTLAEGMTQSITTAFLRGGAKGVIGTIWPIPDQGSHNFALSFYTHALRGETVGTALRLSRAKARTETLTSPLWATYTLYGNPTEQLFAPQRHEQRTVTVLALQLTGFAALHELASPGTAAIWEREFQEELQRLAQRYGGELLSITPSVLLLQFGVPIGLETSALHAAQMALALQRYLQNFHRQEIATLGTQMHYRAAITTGTVLAQWQNTGMPTAHYWVTSNVAEQSQGLVTQVEPNAIWLDSTTHALLQHFFVLQERGEIALPLRNRALSVYQLLDERPANELPVAAANFVGREQELAQLQQWWQEAKRGQGRVVGITGAPGIGKTELIHYFQQEAATTDCHQLRVTCHPFEQSLPHALLRKLIGQLTTIRGEDNAQQRQQKLEQFAGAILQGLGKQQPERQAELLALLGPLVDLPISHSTINQLTPELRQKKLAEAVRAIFVTLAHSRPLLVSIDDLQFADEATLALLRPLLQISNQLPLLLLCTYRPEWETTPLYSPAYRLLSLEAPDPTTQHHLIAHLLGDGHLLTAPVVDAILQRAEGNPLFLREIVNTLKERGALIPTKSGWVLTDEWRTVPLPATIERAIQARLDQLSAPGREVIDRASVIGQEFDYELLEPLQADAIRHELDERLQELTRRQFIQQAGLAFTLSYAFTHGLIQETIYQKLAKEARQWLHRLLAQLLQRRSDSAPELLAYHYVRSSDRLNAIRYTLAAAQHSAENWANATALAWYDSALAKLDSFVVEPPTALEQEQGASDEQLRDWRVNALGGRAAVNGAIGHNEAAIDDYQQVLQLYGDQPNASPVDLAAYHRKLAIAYHDKGAFDEALAALDQGFTLLTGQQSAEVGRHHLWRGMVLFRQGEVAAALAAAQQGVAHFPQRESAADLRDIAQAYNLQGIIYLNLAQTADAIAAHEQSCAYYRQADYLPGLERATSNLGVVYQTLSRWNEALTCYRESATLADRTGEERRKAAALLNMGEIYRRQGNLVEAIASAEQAIQLAAAYALPEAEALAQMNLGAAYLKQGAVEAALRHLTESRNRYAAIGTRLYLPELLRYLAEGQLKQGNTADALTLAEEAKELAVELDQMQLGQACRVLAQVHRALGQQAKAEHLLQESISLLRDQQNRHEVGLTLLAQVELWHTMTVGSAQGNAKSQQAHHALEEAKHIFTALGAQLELAQAKALLTPATR